MPRHLELTDPATTPNTAEHTKEQPMTDSNLPDDVAPVPDDAERADEQQRDANKPGEDKPGSPQNTEPMTDSTDGGLEGGDPGVEE